jgi:hypothetical protein
MESLHDELGLAHAAWLQFGIHWSACRALDSIETLDRGIEHATRAGAAHLAQYLTAWQGAAMMFGPTPAGEVLRDTEEAFASARGTLELATAQRRRGRMLACLGRFDEARAAAYAGMEASRDAGVLVEAGAASMGVAFVETRAGDTEAAERVLRAGVAELEALGERGFLSTVICGLAEILVDRGELDEAAGWCHKARETTGPSDLATLAHVDAVEGLLTALKGDCAGGERLARLAVDLVAQSRLLRPGGWPPPVLGTNARRVRQVRGGVRLGDRGARDLRGEGRSAGRCVGAGAARDAALSARPLVGVRRRPYLTLSAPRGSLPGGRSGGAVHRPAPNAGDETRPAC